MPTFYEYEGWKFEYSRNRMTPPHPVKNNFEPRERVGQKFYEMIDRFLALSEEEQDRLEI